MIKLITYIHALIKVKMEIDVQKKMNRSYLLPYMNSLEERYGGVFPEEQRKKILNYYGLFIPSVLCGSYKRLYGEKLTQEERKRVSLFGILTPIGDDLFDIDKLDVDSIRTIAFQPDTYNATTFSSSVAKEIQSFLLKNVPHKEEYTEAAKNVFDIQLETIRQTDAGITDEEIKNITYAKGGHSVIIYHQTLDEPASPAMLKALFYVGSLMQLANDCFDIYKDIHDGIYTLASRCNDYRQLRKLFIDRVKEANQLIMALPYGNKNKLEFSFVMYFIIARAMVAIEQMIELQDKLGAPVNCLAVDRKQLITDMEKPKNIIKWLYYTYKLPTMA